MREKIYRLSCRVTNSLLILRRTRLRKDPVKLAMVVVILPRNVWFEGNPFLLQGIEKHSIAFNKGNSKINTIKNIVFECDITCKIFIHRKYLSSIRKICSNRSISKKYLNKT